VPLLLWLSAASGKKAQKNLSFRTIIVQGLNVTIDAFQWIKVACLRALLLYWA
jgi:hypothetical protein